MFWLIGLAVGAGAYAAVDAFAIPGAIIMLIAYVIIGISAIDDYTGLSSLMIHSWQWLSGVQDPNQIVQNGQHDAGTNFALLVVILLGYVVLLALAFAIATCGLVAIIGIPAGVIGTFFTSIYALATRKTEPLQQTLKLVILGFACIILAGIGMRLEHIFSVWL